MKDILLLVGSSSGAGKLFQIFIYKGKFTDFVSRRVFLRMWTTRRHARCVLREEKKPVQKNEPLGWTIKVHRARSKTTADAADALHLISLCTQVPPRFQHKTIFLFRQQGQLSASKSFSQESIIWLPHYNVLLTAWVAVTSHKVEVSEYSGLVRCNNCYPFKVFNDRPGFDYRRKDLSLYLWNFKKSILRMLY